MSEVTEGGQARMAFSSNYPATSVGGSRVVVGMVQINNSFSGQNYLPYSVGILQSYVRGHAQNPDRFHFLPPLYKRVAISSAVNDLLAADIVGFSSYVWNAQISLAIARRLKQQRPDVVIVFGGPHVPDHAEQLLRDNPFIDLAAHNEGEITFLRILEMFPSRDWSTLEGDQLHRAERLHTNPQWRAHSRSRGSPLAVSQRRVRSARCRQPERNLDRLMGDQPRLSF